MLTDWIMEQDFMVLNWIQEHVKCDFLDSFFPVFTSLGDKGWIFILVAVVLLCIPRWRKWGASLACSLILGLVFGNMLIKNMVERTRPYDVVGDFSLLVEKLGDYSFPSGHTMASFEFLAVVCMMPVPVICKVFAGLLAVGIAFSRLYLYVHFPSDVLAGALLGTLFGIMGVRIVEMISEKEKAE